MIEIGKVKYKLIDLTMSLGQKTPTRKPWISASHWHGPMEGPSATLVADSGENRSIGWHMSYITMLSHTSTHVDAPYHKLVNGTKLYELPIETYAGSALCLDVSPKGERELVTAEELQRAEKKADGKLEKEDVVLIRTGWSDKYMRGENDAETHCNMTPGFALDAAKWLVKKKVKMVCSDVYSMDPEPTPEQGWKYYLDENNFPAHLTFAKSNTPNIENLVNLAPIAGKRIFFVAFPLKFQNLPDACPVRAVAFLKQVG